MEVATVGISKDGYEFKVKIGLNTTVGELKVQTGIVLERDPSTFGLSFKLCGKQKLALDSTDLQQFATDLKIEDVQVIVFNRPIAALSLEEAWGIIDYMTADWHGRPDDDKVAVNCQRPHDGNIYSLMEAKDDDVGAPATPKKRGRKSSRARRVQGSATEIKFYNNALQRKASTKSWSFA